MSAEIIELSKRRRYRVVRRPPNAAVPAENLFALQMASVALCMEMGSAAIEAISRMAILPLWPGGIDDPEL